MLQATNKTSTEVSSKSRFDENDVRVIDLANDEVTNTEEQKIKDIWSKTENVAPLPPSQPKVVFVKCKVCLKKVRKDMIERHKRVRHALPKVGDEKVNVNTNHQTIPTNTNINHQTIPTNTNTNRQTIPTNENTNQQTETSNNLTSAEVKEVVKVDKQVKKELTDENEIKEAESEIKSGPLNKTDYCTLCHKQFKMRKYLMKHMSKIHRGSEKLDPKRIKTEEFEFKCPECSQTFTSKFYLTKHLLRSHGKHDLTVYCKLCKQEFRFARYLKRHKKSVHSEEMHFFENDTDDLEESYKCSECNETFVTEKIAKYHQLRKHVNTKGEKRQKTKIKTEPLPCKLCKHDFRMKKYLDRHKKSVHTNELHFFEKDEFDQEEKFPCSICSEAFVTENSLKYHQSKKHEEKRQDPNNTCDQCGKVFKENKYLRTHKEVSHGGGGSTSSAQIDQIEKRKCKLCGTQFSEKSSAWNMRRHMLRMHSGTK